MRNYCTQKRRFWGGGGGGGKREREEVNNLDELYHASKAADSSGF